MLSSIARALPAKLLPSGLLSIWLAVVLASAQANAEDQAAGARRIKPIVEVAFVLDTTGSMGPLIEGAKRKSGRSQPPSSTRTRAPRCAWASSPIATSATNT